MIIGQTLVAQNESPANVYFSPWFPRGGNMATFTCDVIAVSASADITSFAVEVETKNAEDGDNDADSLIGGGGHTITLTAGTPTTFSAGQPLDSASQGFKQLVRFRYELTAKASTTAYIHFRMLNPERYSN